MTFVHVATCVSRCSVRIYTVFYYSKIQHNVENDVFNSDKTQVATCGLRMGLLQYVAFLSN